MIVEPKVRGFICTTAHPKGCEAHVTEQIDYVNDKAPINGCKNVLIIGASTGYGLASRIVASFACNAKTLGVFFERPASGKRTASAGWYNSYAFEKAAEQEGIYAKSINGDAFSQEIKNQTIAAIKEDMGKIDLVIYSLASPRRTAPDGVTYSSVLKPINTSYSDKTVDIINGIVSTVELNPASEQEIDDTITVMGGDDWSLWIDALLEADVLSSNATTVAYSYIGPKMTYPIYREGTIGRAKEHLESTANELNTKLNSINGRALVSVNKGLVTQASSAIPVVPLYMSILYKVMKEKDLHEGCIEQIYRLFNDHLYNPSAELDNKGRVRIDDWELKPEVQEEVAAIWEKVTTDNIKELSDILGYQDEFYKLFGFGLQNVDYSEDVDIEVGVESFA